MKTEQPDYKDLESKELLVLTDKVIKKLIKEVEAHVEKSTKR